MDISETAQAEAVRPADTLILLAVTDTVILPGTVVPLAIGRPGAAAALQEAARTDQHLAVVLQREPFAETPGLRDLHAIGTEVRLLRYFTGRDGSHNAIVQGIGRLRPQALDATAPYATLTAEHVAEPIERTPDIDARAHQLRERALDLLKLIDQAPAEIASMVRSIEPPGALADFVAGLLDLSPFEKQEILETVALLPRLDRVLTRLAYRYEVLRLSSDIGQQTRAAMEGAPEGVSSAGTAQGDPEGTRRV